MTAPRAALRRCRRCGQLVRGRCLRCERARGRQRPASETSWYGAPAWRARSAAQLAAYPACARCGAPATVAGHVTPHHGDWEAFIGGALVSLCYRCNRQQAVEDEKG
jgi:hypothetical protein